MRPRLSRPHSGNQIQESHMRTFIRVMTEANFLMTVVITAFVASLAFASKAQAQSAGAQRDTQILPAVVVRDAPTVAESNNLPATTEGISARKAADTINVINTEDAVKYLPSILVRKRYTGDTNAPIATRTTGINASARSLIFVDGLLLSTLVNNNNGNGSPQWFMVAPEEIDRIHVMYGPFSAAYAGNSYGAVVEISTRMPRKFEASAKVTEAFQKFNLYGTNDTYRSQQGSAVVGNRNGDLSWWVSANHLDSYSQPITFGTVTRALSGAVAGLPVVSGGFSDQNRFGQPILVVGGQNFSHAIQDNLKVKLAYDFMPGLTAAYTLGYWQNDTKAESRSYLGTAGGAAYFGGTAGNVNIGGVPYSASTIAGQFSSNRAEQEHLMQSVSLKFRNNQAWDWEALFSKFNYTNDKTRASAPVATPGAVAGTNTYPAAQGGGFGSITDAGGTGWTTLDLKGVWRPQGLSGAHIVNFGLHRDEYTLSSPVYSTANWISGSAGALSADSRGKTRTTALWAQDVWRFAPRFALTLGGRYETWSAYDGYNFSTSAAAVGFPVNQPGVNKSGFSPKASLLWELSAQWSATASLGKALRFPTVGELYQNVTTGATFTQANPFLKPENVKAGELALERNTEKGKQRISVFQENVSDWLFSQTSVIAGVAAPVAFVQNIDAVRNRGVEFVAQQNDFLVRGLELNASVTYVDGKVTGNGSYVVPTTSPAGSVSLGRRTPYVPDWRTTFTATYRPNESWAYTVAGRYQSKLWATIDNTDYNSATYQGFQGFFVADTRVRYQLAKQWSAAVGIDNLFNQKYWLFHPFPQRTLVAEMKFSY
jgi:iron complex outermembrane receptor protein